ncbi:MAG: TVP38/TMEM64 family protein [Solirubrobacterales bacterium]
MTAPAPKRHPLLDPRILMRGMVLIVTLVAVGVLIEGLGLKDMMGEQWIDAEIRGKGLTGEAIFFGLATVLIAIGIPRQALSFLGGYAFGFGVGTALTLAATLIGSIGAFQYARFMGREFMLRRFPHRIKKIDDFLAGNTAVMALILRLSPLSNNLAANLAAGVSGVRLVPFFAGSAIGYLPQTLVFALLGSGFEVDAVLRTALSVALFIVSTVLGLWLWRKYRSEKGLPEDLPEEA